MNFDFVYKKPTSVAGAFHLIWNNAEILNFNFYKSCGLLRKLNRDISTVFQLEADNATKMRLAQLDFTKGTNPANETETEEAEDIEDPKEPKVKEEE